MSLNRIWFELWTKTLLVAAAFSLAALCLAACASDPKSPAVTARNPGALYALKAESATDKIALAMHANGLSAAQRDALGAMAARRVQSNGGVVTVSLPRSGADPALAGRLAETVAATFNVDGAPVVRSTYETDDPKAPLLVSYEYDKADVPACNRAWDDLTHTADNRVYSNFGCAVTANMAAQIANPSDLRRPRGEDAPDAVRRLTVLGKYQDGKVTSADDDVSKSAIIAKVAH